MCLCLCDADGSGGGGDAAAAADGAADLRAQWHSLAVLCLTSTMEQVSV